MNLTEPHQTPRWALWTILICIAGILMIVSAELALRLIPGPWSGAFFHRYDPDLGTWHLSNFSGKNMSADYSVRASFNSFGMRDRERTLAKTGTLRSAVLGDSFVEGLQVADTETFTRQMEELFEELNKNGYFVATYEGNELKIFHKYREKQVFKNVWTDKRYQSEFHGTNLLKDILGKNIFNYPLSFINYFCRTINYYLLVIIWSPSCNPDKTTTYSLPSKPVVIVISSTFPDLIT